MSWLKSLFGAGTPTTVTLQPSGRSFKPGKDETILERALKEKIAYPHDCTVGTCGACRSKLLSGKVDAITPFGYTLSREELAQGYILACQALPRGDVTVAVDIPDRKMPVPVRTSGRISAIRDLTHDIKQVTWRVDTPIDYVAGQYMNIGWLGLDGTRSYSFCDAPVSDGRAEVSAFVRRVPGGAFSELLFAGDPLAVDFTIDGPHGNFRLRPGEGPILCIAGGSGLSPLMSLLEDALARGVERDALLLFGARGERDLYCRDQIAAIAQAWKGRFDFWPVLSETPVPELRSGFVTAHVGAALDWLGTVPQAYMCGPPGMIDAAVAALVPAGIPLDDIHYDKFTDAGTKAAGAKK